MAVGGDGDIHHPCVHVYYADSPLHETFQCCWASASAACNLQGGRGGGGGGEAGPEAMGSQAVPKVIPEMIYISPCQGLLLVDMQSLGCHLHKASCRSLGVCPNTILGVTSSTFQVSVQSNTEYMPSGVNSGSAQATLASPANPFHVGVGPEQNQPQGLPDVSCTADGAEGRKEGGFFGTGQHA